MRGVVQGPCYFVLCCVRLGAKSAGVGNRKVLALSLVLVLAGSVLFGDWQSIGQDPCVSFSSNVTDNDCSIPGSGSGREVSTGGEDPATDRTAIQELVERCQNLSGPSSTCFWNRQSRVTGEYCTECVGTCLSTERSQNIYQLSLAVIFLSIGTPLGYIFTSAIVSDITPLNSQVAFAPCSHYICSIQFFLQGLVLSMVLGIGFFTRTVTPFWCKLTLHTVNTVIIVSVAALDIKSYEVTGRHTYFAMAIVAGCTLTLLLSLLVLYKHLAPIPKTNAVAISANGTNTVAISVNGKLDSEAPEKDDNDDA